HGVVADLTGQVIERRSVEIDPGRPVPALIAELAATARELARHGRGELLGAGAGMPGPVGPEGGAGRGSASPRESRHRGPSARPGRGGLRGAGVGMPGPVDPEEGVYRGSASSADAWAGAPIRALLLEELALPVHLDHDSRAALVGESWSQPGLLDNAALVLA